MLTSIRESLKEKGQGLTEYVLVLAFVAMIAYVMISGESNLKTTVSSTFSDSNNKLSNAASNVSQ